MSSLPRAAAALLCAAALVVAGSSTAYAGTKTVQDEPRDAPARFDLTRVSYVNGAERVILDVRLRDAGRSGSVTLTASRPSSDVFYLATISRTAKRGVTTSFDVDRGGGSSPEKCRVRGSWGLRSDQVRIVVPHTCLGRSGRLLMSAGTRTGFGGDLANSRLVARG